MDRILRRFDELIERVSGYGLFGPSASSSVMDAAGAKRVRLSVNFD